MESEKSRMFRQRCCLLVNAYMSVQPGCDRGCEIARHRHFPRLQLDGIAIDCKTPAGEN